MIKGISITIIIDGIKNEQILELINSGILNLAAKNISTISTEKYTKFPDAYKMEYQVLTATPSTKEKLHYQMLLLADGIAQPWLIYFDRENNNSELIFNREEHTLPAQPEFSPIRWAHIQLIY